MQGSEPIGALETLGRGARSHPPGVATPVPLSAVWHAVLALGLKPPE